MVGPLTRFGGHPTISPGASPTPTSDEAFQDLLLVIAAKAAERVDANSLIHFFCRATREFFRVSGVYFWRCMAESEGELIGAEADGKLAEGFRGRRLKPEEGAVTIEAVRRRRAIFVNHLDPENYTLAAEFGVRSLMSVPLVVFHEAIGAATFLHDSEPAFFNDDLAAKATILAGQLGSLLEANRLRLISREEHRRTEILADVAQVLHGTPDISSVIEALADRLRLLLRTRLVCVLLRREGPFELRAVSAETPQLAHSVRARHDRQTIRFSADLAQRAVAAGELVTISISNDIHSLGNLVSAGMLIAAPFRTTSTQGAILVYPRAEGAFTAEEKALVSAIAGFGAVAVAHAELYATAHAQAHELHQLLEISSELSSSGDLEQFLKAFVVRASDFLGYGRCFVAFYEDGEFRVRWGVEKGEPRRLESIFPEGLATRALMAKEVFWSDDVSKLAGANLEVIAQYHAKQLLAVPLLDTRGEVLGMFGVLDRIDGAGISQEDIRRARALAAPVAVVLEVARNLHQSEQHRHRAESLMELAREIDGLLRLPDFARRFVDRAVELTGARAGVFALFQEGRFETVALHPAPDFALPRADRGIETRINQALTELIAKRDEAIVSGSAAELLGSEVAAELGWEDCSVVRLPGATGELAGMLCLSGPSSALASTNHDLLEALAGHAAMALENARLFTRIEQANRHWLEIFDAISDFIVVHDETHKVLRVNRSLADFIGIAPGELVGVNMRALLNLNSDLAPHSCPFCHSTGSDNDEFVHPLLDRTYLVSTSRVHGASSEGMQTIHVLKDISDRREAERRYRELFDNIQEGLFFSTPEGRFIEVNDAMVQMLGYSSREELLQVDIPTEIYFTLEQRQRHHEAMEAEGNLRNFELTLRRKDGSPIHVLINAFGMHDNRGRLLQIRGLMLDVTGLRASQFELSRERDFSGKIVNNTQSLILVADAAGLISYANRRWYEAGYEQRELLGRPLLDLAAPGYVRALADALEVNLGGQPVDNLEVQITRGNGSAGQFSVNLSPMRDEQGRISSIVVVMTDITDSAVLRDKLVHAEKMAAVGQLVSGVAHEVNNPLTAILGFADLLLENPAVPESARKDLRVILQEAQRTKQIVQNLLSFARQMPPQRIAVQVNVILRRTIQLRSYDFTSHGVEIVEHLDEGLPEVMGDAHQLQQVFLNILNNAYDAVHESGRPPRIEIMTTKAGGSVEISFRDNGPGVSDPDKIFNPFFTTKEIGKGTGLGLSICYGIVKEHGGEILCHNNSSGEGATFIVRLAAVPHSASLGVAAGVIPR
jgi:PAS domain S-box-containing protein